MQKCNREIFRSFKRIVREFSELALLRVWFLAKGAQVSLPSATAARILAWVAVVRGQRCKSMGFCGYLTLKEPSSSFK